MGAEMKDSGVKWIGMIPENWNCCKQKHVLQLINGRAYSDSEFETDGKYRVLRVGNLFSNPIWYTSSLELDKDKYCSAGDLLYSWSMSYSPIIWQGDKVIYHYHIWKVKPSKDVDKKFAFYYLNALTSALQAEIHETTMGFITMGVMNKSYIAFPELIEQEKIALFLDTQCAEIEAIITRTRESIEEYKKLKQAVITQAVTKGIRGDRPMKDSGVEWIGEIPDDWRTAAIKRSFKIVAGSTPNSMTEKFWDGDIVWITPADFKTKDHYVSIGRRNITKEGYDSCGTTLIPAGSVLFSKRAPVGTVCINKISLCTNQGCLSCIPNEKVSSNYFYYTMSVCTKQFNLLSAGTTFKEISANSFMNFILPLPPYNEQLKISEFIDLKCAEIDTLIAKKEQYLVELENYKKSLIYEYVTGKKEVV